MLCPIIILSTVKQFITSENGVFWCSLCILVLMLLFLLFAPTLAVRLSYTCISNVYLFEQLAEVFRQGSNFLKLCVLRVCEESERHLDKVMTTCIISA